VLQYRVAAAPEYPDWHSMVHDEPEAILVQDVLKPKPEKVWEQGLAVQEGPAVESKFPVEHVRVTADPE